MPRFFYFDLGNVLVTFDHQIAVRQLAQLADRPADRVWAAVFESDLQTRFETGLIAAGDFTAEVNRVLATDLREPDVMLAISAIFQPNPAILQVLKRLKGAGVGIGVLSNTCDAHWMWLMSQRWPMLDRNWFREVILSYEVKSMKPDVGIYEASEQSAKCAGNQIFFTDDRADNIAAAAARGWVTYQFGSVDGLLSRLDNWLS